MGWERTLILRRGSCKRLAALTGRDPRPGERGRKSRSAQAVEDGAHTVVERIKANMHAPMFFDSIFLETTCLVFVS